jgi:hypothetical protein
MARPLRLESSGALCQAPEVRQRREASWRLIERVETTATLTTTGRRNGFV